MRPTRGERLQIMLTEEELKALDDWRFAKHMPSRAAAIRELLKRGLAAEGFDIADFRNKSKEFGVTGTLPDHDAGDMQAGDTQDTEMEIEDGKGRRFEAQDKTDAAN